MPIAIVALLAVTIGVTEFRELECSGVPLYPEGKRIVLREGQLRQSAVDEDFFSLVEFEGMVALLHYDVRRVGPKMLQGTATRISTTNWKTVTSSVSCRILN